MQPEVCRTFFTRNKTRSASSHSLPVGQNQIGYGIGDMLNRVEKSAQASLSFHPGRPIHGPCAYPYQPPQCLAYIRCLVAEEK
jgi:hypothetical protein